MSVHLIEFRNFKEKIAITKQYYGRAKMQIIENKYIYLEWRTMKEQTIRAIELLEEEYIDIQNTDYFNGVGRMIEITKEIELLKESEEENGSKQTIR